MERILCVDDFSGWTVTLIVILIEATQSMSVALSEISCLGGSTASMGIGSPRVHITLHNVELRALLPSILATTVVVAVSRVVRAIFFDGCHPDQIESGITSTLSLRIVFVIFESTT